MILRGYDTLEVLGPEHEFSLVDEFLKPLPIVDKIIKKLCGRIKNNVSLSGFEFGKELQAHVAEFKALEPFRSPCFFEETMQEAVLEILGVLEGFRARLLGLGMHPTLNLDEAQIWSHRDRKIYEAFDRLFDIKRHGWLNIQSFQLNLPYRNEYEAVKLYNSLVKVLPYIPAISASSPIYDSVFGDFVDNRLHFYKINQQKIPSITGNIVPKRINSFEDYRNLTIRKYSADLKRAGAPVSLLNKEWINSRGTIIRFDRKAIEIRIIDEQECIKSDVALSCFIRALLRGIISSENPSYPQASLVQDLNSVISDGLNAKVKHNSSTAREVCRRLYGIAYENASVEERNYLKLILTRIEEGNLSELISRDVKKRAKKTDLEEAILEVYLNLAENLAKNQIYK